MSLMPVVSAVDHVCCHPKSTGLLEGGDGQPEDKLCHTERHHFTMPGPYDLKDVRDTTSQCQDPTISRT